MPGSENTGGMGVDDLRVAASLFLHQAGRLAISLVLQAHNVIVLYICNGEMHILACWYIQGIACLVGIDDICEMPQHRHRSDHIIEGKVHVVGMVRENIL